MLISEKCSRGVPANLESCRTCGGAAKFVAVELACRQTAGQQKFFAKWRYIQQRIR